jgi:hypothetical protein
VFYNSCSFWFLFVRPDYFRLHFNRFVDAIPKSLHLELESLIPTDACYNHVLTKSEGSEKDRYTIDSKNYDAHGAPLQKKQFIAPVQRAFVSFVLSLARRAAAPELDQRVPEIGGRSRECNEAVLRNAGTSSKSKSGGVSLTASAVALARPLIATGSAPSLGI